MQGEARISRLVLPPWNHILHSIRLHTSSMLLLLWVVLAPRLFQLPWLPQLAHPQLSPLVA